MAKSAEPCMTCYLVRTVRLCASEPMKTYKKRNKLSKVNPLS